MNFKEQFVETLKENYSAKVREKRDTAEAKKHAAKLIHGFFEHLHHELKDVASVSSALKFYDSPNFEIQYKGNCYIRFPFGDKNCLPERLKDSFQVEVARFGLLKRDTLKIEGNRYKSKMFDMDLSEDLLDVYLKYVFEEAISEKE
ncbi:hypothetical protein [Bacillus thermotolerans]|uniref:Uncharacterized protein n=1 Tax=Bacillus thermotolerans TaxID=1221996 RepID=A0A0F5HY74_BACTR|nr:hypothetical protein [Bacillus thermotolerans]KKB34434.1 hypothetical protein QY97_02507 [Bacillus thermotolerans]KKB38178.1 hypothetical protein QY95_02633 [Bacillus thermotolerans]